VGQRAVVAYLRLVNQWTRRIGQALLYPPDVAGWEWGTAWISSQTMLERMRFAEVIVPNRGPLGFQTLRELLGTEPARTLEGFIDRLGEVLDVALSKETREKLQEYLQKRGGVTALARADRTVVQGILQIVFASPEFQML